jgi:hypothetical protein
MASDHLLRLATVFPGKTPLPANPKHEHHCNCVATVIILLWSPRSARQLEQLLMSPAPAQVATAHLLCRAISGHTLITGSLLQQLFKQVETKSYRNP